MSLHDSIERRRMAEPPVVTCVGPSVQAPNLVLSMWRGSNWALPWSYLESAQLVPANGYERILLSFAKHRVTISGENLRGLWDDVTAFRIGCLRDLPPQYRSQIAADAPFITSIEVTELAESDAQKSAESKQGSAAR